MWLPAQKDTKVTKQHHSHNPEGNMRQAAACGIFSCTAQTALLTISYLSKSAFLYLTLCRNNWFHLGAQEYREMKKHVVMLELGAFRSLRIDQYRHCIGCEVLPTLPSCCSRCFQPIYHANLLLILKDLFNYGGSSLSKNN